MNGFDNDNLINEEELLAFLTRIVSIRNSTRIRESLYELVTIMDRNGASQESIQYVQEMMKASLELSDLSTKAVSRNKLSMEDVEIALRRAEERRAREAACRC